MKMFANSPVSQDSRARHYSLRLRLAGRVLDVPIEVVLVEDLDLVASRKDVRHSRQVISRHPHRGLLRVPSWFAHRHRRQCRSTRN